MRWILFLASAAAAAGAAVPAANTPIGVVQTWAPFFPSTASVMGLDSGTVTVVVDVDSSGHLVDALAVDATHPVFAAAAVNAAHHWEYRPAVHNGQPIEAVRALLFNFATEGTVLVTRTIEENIAARFISVGTERYRWRAYQLNEVDVPPTAVSMPSPAFPQTLRASGVTGLVKLSFFIDENGRVRLPVVTNDPPPAMAEAAVAAVREWRFNPAMRHGQRVLLHVGQTIRFGPEG